MLVRIKRLGICGTDVDLYTGDITYMKNGLSALPFRPGYEWCGTVVAVANGVTNVSAGEWVVGEPFSRAATASSVAEVGETIARRGASSGCAAILPEPRPSTCDCRPRTQRPSPILSAPPTPCCANRSSRCCTGLSVTRLEPGESLGIIGAGTLGLLAVQVARSMGASVEVLGVSDRMRLALSMGANRVLHVADAEPDRYDVVIEASGGADTLALAVRVANIAGRIAQVGMPGDAPVPVDAVAIVTKWLQVHGVLGGLPYLARAVRLLEEEVVRPGELIDRVLPWNDYGVALVLIMNRGLARPKVILNFTGVGSS